MVKRPPPVAVCLVDVRAVLEQEFAGRQRVLVSKQLFIIIIIIYFIYIAPCAIKKNCL